MQRKIGKKGIAAYLSWVILIGLALVISLFMYTWITSNVNTTLTFVEESDDNGVCQDVGISIVNVCQNAQTLNTNISNVKLQGISGLKFRFYDLYDNTESRERNLTIRPKDVKSVEVIKQGTLKQAEIIPVTTKDSKVITCLKSAVTIENIKICG